LHCAHHSALTLVNWCLIWPMFGPTNPFYDGKPISIHSTHVCLLAVEVLHFRWAWLRACCFWGHVCGLSNVVYVFPWPRAYNKPFIRGHWRQRACYFTIQKYTLNILPTAYHSWS
jgi:hypothetical protein